VIGKQQAYGAEIRMLQMTTANIGGADKVEEGYDAMFGGFRK
jgi:hypothetical protein